MDYNTERRPNADGLVQLDTFGRLAEQHAAFMLARDSQDPLRVFAEHSVGIYRQLRRDNAAAKKAAVNLARAERIAQLVALFESSGIIKFIFIKSWAWWLRDQIERRRERRMQNV